MAFDAPPPNDASPPDAHRGARSGTPGRVTDDRPRRQRRFEEQGFFKRILPRTVLGFASLLFFMAIASAFSGAALFAFYRFELDQTREELADVRSEIADDVVAAEQVIEKEREEATAEIEQQLAELERFEASSLTIEELLEVVGDSVYLVTSVDEAGQPSVGTAFVLFSDSERSFLLTSYTTIRAATVQPGPGVEVRRGNESLQVSINGWDPVRDLALLVAENAPNLPTIELGDPSEVRPGNRVYAVSGLGGSGGAIVQGQVADVASNAIQHDAPIGLQFQGSPLVDVQGRLLAVASRSFSPLGFVPDDVYFAVPLREVCAEVVQCPSSLTG